MNYGRRAFVAVVAVLSIAATADGVQPAVDADSMISAIATRWAGDFTNHRQVDANIVRGEPDAPELTRERREMKVIRLDAPQLGKAVLFYEEFRATQPGRAHRQRVVALVFDAQTQRVRAEQLFFKTGPTYDRKPIDAASVSNMSRTDFQRQPKCDLYFIYEA